MNTEKIKKTMKKIRDFILCCRKTMDHVEDMIEDIDSTMTTRKIISKPIVYDRPTKECIHLEPYFR